MSTTMVSTVLEIEREAEDIISAAKLDAEKLISDAHAQCDNISREILGKARQEVDKLEEQAAAERTVKTGELAAAGNVALAAVKNVSAAAYDSGIQCVLRALAEK